MAKSVQFPVKLPLDFEQRIKFEGRDIKPLPQPNTVTTALTAGAEDIYENRVDRVNVPIGKCWWVESINWGGQRSGNFQCLVSPGFNINTAEDAWGLGGADENDPDASSAQVYNFRQFGDSGNIPVRKWFRENTSFQLTFQSFEPGVTRFAAHINGIEFTGNAGLNFGADKKVLMCGASTSWYLLGTWRSGSFTAQLNGVGGDETMNTNYYRPVTSGSVFDNSAVTGSAINYQTPDLRGSSVTYPDFSGDSLALNQFTYQLMKDGKDFRAINKSFGGSNFTQNWFWALETGYLNGVDADLILIEAGVNDAKQEQTVEYRELYKNRLTKFIEWRDRFNPGAPVVFIAPVGLDDGHGINLGTEPGTVNPDDVGVYVDPRTSSTATGKESGSAFNTRNTWDSGSSGIYNVPGVGNMYMTRLEIVRQMTKEVATSASLGGGSANNVYFVDGIEADYSCSVMYREELPETGSATPGTWYAQQGLRFAKYHKLNSTVAGTTGSVYQKAKDDGYLDPVADSIAHEGIVGEITYYSSGSTSMSPYEYKHGGSKVTPIYADTQDHFFKWVRQEEFSDQNKVEQHAGFRVHRSPQGHEALAKYLKVKLSELGVYDNL